RAEGQSVRELRPEVPRELSDWIARLLEPDPDRRPDSAASAREQLQAIMGPPRKRRPWWVVLMVLAVVAAALAWWLTRDEDKPPPPHPAAAKATALTAGDLRVTLPPGWRTLSTPPAVDGLALTDAQAAAPGGRDGGPAVVVGLAGEDADRPSMLAPGLLR